MFGRVLCSKLCPSRLSHFKGAVHFLPRSSPITRSQHNFTRCPMIARFVRRWLRRAMGFQNLRTTRVGVEPSGGLIVRKLLIPQNGKFEKNCKKAEPRYTAGTRNNSLNKQLPTENYKTAVSVNFARFRCASTVPAECLVGVTVLRPIPVPSPELGPFRSLSPLLWCGPRHRA